MRDFEALTYQTVAMFIKCTHVQLPSSPRITYDRVLCARAFCPQSFRAMGQPYSLASFGLRFGSCDLTMCMDAKGQAVCSAYSFLNVSNTLSISG